MTLYSSSILDLKDLAWAAFKSGILHTILHCWSTLMKICAAPSVSYPA